VDCSSGSRRQSNSTTVPLVLADNWRRVDFKVSLSLIPSDSSSHDSKRIPLHFPLVRIGTRFSWILAATPSMPYSKSIAPGDWSPSVIGRNALVATGIQPFLR